MEEALEVKVFHDWESLENGVTIAPISVGMVREDGSEYYAVFAGAPFWEIQQNFWLNKNVWPVTSLDGESPVEDGEAYFKSRDEIAIDVREFLTEVPGLELWGDYCAYDHVCLAQLYGTMLALPQGIPMFTSDLQTEIAWLGLENSSLPPRPAYCLPKHNALRDARYELLISKFLQEYRSLGFGPDRLKLRAEAIEGRWSPR